MQLYQPPAPGASDSADPHFKPRLRECGKPGCDRTFETTARWRFFCPKCRVSPVVKKTQRHTFSIFQTRRPGGAE